MTNMTQIMRVTIHRTCAGPQAKPQSAWSKQSSPWSNLPKGWGSPTLVLSTNGRHCGWLGLLRTMIGRVSGDRTVSNSSVMDPCTGRRWLQIFWRLPRPGSIWKILIMPKGFIESRLGWFWSNVQARFGRRGSREGKATSDGWQIRESALAKQREVSSQSCQMKLSWLSYHGVLIGNNDQTSSMQLLALYTDVRHWQELIDFTEQHCGLEEPYCLTTIYKCNMTQQVFDRKYMGLYPPGQMMNDPLYGQISYDSSLSNAFKLKLGHNEKLVLVEMKTATGKDIAEHIMRPVKVIPLAWLQLVLPHCYAGFLDFGGIRWKRKSGGSGCWWEEDWQ